MNLLRETLDAPPSGWKHHRSRSSAGLLLQWERDISQDEFDQLVADTIPYIAQMDPSGLPHDIDTIQFTKPQEGAPHVHAHLTFRTIHPDNWIFQASAFQGETMRTLSILAILRPLDSRYVDYEPDEDQEETQVPAPPKPDLIWADVKWIADLLES